MHENDELYWHKIKENPFESFFVHACAFKLNRFCREVNNYYLYYNNMLRKEEDILKQ